LAAFRRELASIFAYVAICPMEATEGKMDEGRWMRGDG
jgi:hypothetical protein